MTTDKSESPDKKAKNKEPKPATLIQHCFHYWSQKIWSEGDTGPCHFTLPGAPCFSLCPNWKSYTFKSGFTDWYDLMKDKRYKGAIPKTMSRGCDVIQMNIGYDQEPKATEKRTTPEVEETVDLPPTPPPAPPVQKEPEKKKNAWF